MLFYATVDRGSINDQNTKMVHDDIWSPAGWIYVKQAQRSYIYIYGTPNFDNIVVYVLKPICNSNNQILWRL